MMTLSLLSERVNGEGGDNFANLTSHSSQKRGEPNTAIAWSSRKGRKRLAHSSLGTTSLSKMPALENRIVYLAQAFAHRDG